MAEALAGVDVAEMNFDCWDARGANGVVNGNRRVGVGTSVYEEPVKFLCACLDPTDQFAFAVRLSARGGVPASRSMRFDHVVNVVEGLVAISLGLTGTQHVQVRPVQDQKAGGHDVCSLFDLHAGRT